MRNLPTAFFLACAWFWCIGGFFPVLLEHDFGPVAFMVFFIVNVTGAALFGFVLDAEKRTRFLERFAPSAQLFSVVVIAYHFVFISWLTTLLGTPWPIIGFIAATCAFIALRHSLIGLSIGVFVVTVALFVMALSYPAPIAPPTPIADGFIHYILPLALGFLLAPYFDLTFHRAFAESPNPRLSFLIGFGGLFALLLVGMFFATPIFSALITQQGLTNPALQLVVALLVLQTSFTTAAHVRELEGSRWLKMKFALPTVVSICLLCSFHFAVAWLAPAFKFAFGDLIYRTLLFVIGVLFPVNLIFGGINRRTLIAAALLTPCYTLGFLIGGPYAPALSIGMAALAIMMYVWRANVFRAV